MSGHVGAFAVDDASFDHDPGRHDIHPTSYVNEDTHASDAVDEWWTLLVLLSPAIVTMSLILLAYVVVRNASSSASSAQSSAGAPNGIPKRRRRTQKNAFTNRPSRLDTAGNLLTSWRSVDSSSQIDQSEYNGFYNLIFIIVVYVIITNVTTNYIAHGTLLRDQGKRLWNMLKGLPELVVGVVAIYLYSFSVVPVQKLVASGRIKGVWVSLTNYGLQAILVTVVGYYTLHESTAHWPVSQKACLLIQTSVLWMKMHSYFATNMQLLRAHTHGSWEHEPLVKEYAPASPSTGNGNGNGASKLFADSLPSARSASDDGSSSAGEEAMDGVPAYTEDDVMRSTVRDLRALCGSLGLPGSGTKSSLCDRLVQHRRNALLNAGLGSEGRGNGKGHAAGSEFEEKDEEGDEGEEDTGTESEDDGWVARGIKDGNDSDPPPYTEADIQSLTVRELRDLCRDAGLSVTGRKTDLCSRLLEYQREFLADDDTDGLRERASSGSDDDRTSHDEDDLDVFGDDRQPSSNPNKADVAVADAQRGVGPASGPAAGLTLVTPRSVPKVTPADSPVFASDKATLATEEQQLPWIADTFRQYPDNVTLWNFFLFTISPVLVYEPTYPRRTTFRPMYVLEKTMIAVGLLACGFVVLDQHVYPVLATIDQPGTSVVQAVASLIVPFVAMWLIIFFIIFECILNAIAELTYFGDREFYSDWWNATSFDVFARKWNLPVHEFLLRHVYLEGMAHHDLSQTAATTVTFLVSIIWHELILICAFNLVRPWLALFSLAQLPLIPLMRLPIFRGKRLGNFVVWFGLVTGPPLMATMYAREYCKDAHCAVSLSS